jgi:phytoene/squalene synthetase
MELNPETSQTLAIAITKAASKQSYYTIRFLVDRERVGAAYQAYGYFRWVDDTLDEPNCAGSEKAVFLQRQQALLNACYRGQKPQDLCPQEQMLADLVRGDSEAHSGLQSYLRNMMGVMAFDTARCGRTITQAELAEYTRMLATAVSEAMCYFIGNDTTQPNTPHTETCYPSVIAAHITHMLRDTIEDVEAGYFNIPREYLQAHGISASDVNSPAYHEWVTQRIALARAHFKAGRACIARVKSPRRRLAGYAYTVRFEFVLRLIERDHGRLRREYPERKGLRAFLWMTWSTLTSLLAYPWIKAGAQQQAANPLRMEGQ